MCQLPRKSVRGILLTIIAYAAAVVGRGFSEGSGTVRHGWADFKRRQRFDRRSMTCVVEILTALGFLESLGGVRTQPDRAEHRLDPVRGPQVRPVRLRKRVERQAPIQIILQAGGRSIILGFTELTDQRLLAFASSVSRPPTVPPPNVPRRNSPLSSLTPCMPRHLLLETMLYFRPGSPFDAVGA